MKMAAHAFTSLSMTKALPHYEWHACDPRVSKPYAKDGTYFTSVTSKRVWSSWATSGTKLVSSATARALAATAIFWCPCGKRTQNNEWEMWLVFITCGSTWVHDIKKLNEFSPICLHIGSPQNEPFLPWKDFHETFSYRITTIFNRILPTLTDKTKQIGKGRWLKTIAKTIWELKGKRSKKNLCRV